MKKILIAILLIGGAFLILMNNDSVETDHNEAIQEHHDDDDEVEEHEIYPGDVVKKIEAGEDIILLDVRTPEEHAEVHIENSLLVPVQELSLSTLAEAGIDESKKDAEIIIYCRSGNRSKQAYDIMKSLGFTNIKSSAGGIVHWEEDNYPYLEEGEYVAPMVDETTASGAKIVIDNGKFVFGKASKVEGVLETTFVIKNEGAETLEIGDITTSCGCTSAEIEDQSISPGSETKLTVKFDPNFHEEPEGVFTRTVFIPTNDPNTPEAEVSIEVEIID